MEPRRNSSAPAAPAHPVSAVAATSRAANGNILNTVLVVVLIITSVLATAYLGSRLAAGGSSKGTVKSKAYQALFLTNGQVYFGHLTGIDNSYVKLTSIYYLQVQQTVQPGQSKDQSQNVSLAKLGGELHGPEDSMYVSREQVLFWENLKGSGKVAQAIKSYQSSGKQ